MFIKKHCHITVISILSAVLIPLITSGCSSQAQETAGIQNIQESAQDADVDFSLLAEVNPDIFAWLYIPGTNIDCPVLQNAQSDDFYENHNVYGTEGENGAAYIELANQKNMCDFNTVIHGRTTTDEMGLFADLYQFTDISFFDEHEQIYLYLDGNVLTYEIFAVYERENTNLLRSYDFTDLSDCQRFLDDVYGMRDMSARQREGWNFVNPYHFLITLTTQKGEDDQRQLVIVAVLTQDSAGKINRFIYE